ncbi:hypothetical protein SAMN05660649_00925 [Desulfotomaculum arcticum]|uniref:Uncharacterized protein n=1 Tax=Desulfotruncus arcticus DSM 17038 TaxID=1121424 RepID=A0A1I2PIK6_9FIRM|nr:hypothetical protein [Desulfotruncus arcticus]SFG16035.1 hypothetical protein SAMN05660649_00925 [Desulfotomaculum arcticum] [Desulfotruncus arcticus DSM 17038]
MYTTYYKTWEQYLAVHPEIDEKQAKAMAPKMQGYEDMMFSFIMFLLM